MCIGPLLTAGRSINGGDWIASFVGISLNHICNERSTSSDLPTTHVQRLRHNYWRSVFFSELRQTNTLVDRQFSLSEGLSPSYLYSCTVLEMDSPMIGLTYSLRFFVIETWKPYLLMNDSGEVLQSVDIYVKIFWKLSQQGHSFEAFLK